MGKKYWMTQISPTACSPALGAEVTSDPELSALHHGVGQHFVVHIKNLGLVARASQVTDMFL